MRSSPLKLAALVAAALAAAAVTTAVAFGSVKGNNGMPVVDVSMTGHSISVSGTLLSGAVDVQSVVTGEFRGAPIFVRLNDGVTADQLVAFMNSNSKQAADLNNVSPYGSIVYDNLDAEPLSANDVETILQPGNYVAFDAAAALHPAGWPYTTFTIDANSSPSRLPTADEWQKAVDFRFRGPATLHTGQVIRATNSGWVVDDLWSFQVKSRKAGHKVIKLLRAGRYGVIDAIVHSVGQDYSLFGPISHGAVQQFVFNANPGWYVEACFMGTQDGREYTQLGMERLVQVVH